MMGSGCTLEPCAPKTKFPHPFRCARHKVRPDPVFCSLVLALVTGTTLCPVIKKLRTPSWAFYSGAVVLWVFALFYWFIDIKGHKAWTFPLVVVGMNSIAIYVAYQLTAGWIRSVGRT